MIWGLVLILLSRVSDPTLPDPDPTLPDPDPTMVLVLDGYSENLAHA